MVCGTSIVNGDSAALGLRLHGVGLLIEWIWSGGRVADFGEGQRNLVRLGLSLWC